MLKGEIVQISTQGVSPEKVSKMEEKNRKTGIDAVGDAPFGTHFCLFYETKEDLIDVLVPYFKAGLESNEFCMWVTSEPLSEEEAKEAMRRAVPNFDGYVERGQIEIVPYTEWYLKGGAFSLQRVLNGWVEKLNQALAKGYDGMRLTGNTAWLEKRGWKNFVDYEQEVNDVIGKYRMMALCAYSLDKCGASEVIDVVRNHQFAVIKRAGEWELIESSEIKRTEASLRETEERYRELTESISDVFFAMDKDFRYTYWNKASEKLTGISAKDAIGKSLTEVFPDVKGTKIEQLYLETLRTQKPQSYLNKYQLDGKDYVFEINAYPTKTGLSVFVKDITERKKAEEKLDESEKKFKSIFEGARDGILAADAKTKKFVLANPRICEITGYSEKELLRLGVEDIHPEKDLPYVIDAFTKQLQRKIEIGRDMPVLRKDRNVIYCDINSYLLEVGERKLLVGLFRDVTERKKMETQLKEYSEHLEEKVEERTNQLKKAQEQLLKAERFAAIGEVANMVGHDLRNPLQSIENAAYYLNTELSNISAPVPISQKTMEMLKVINDSINHADKIILDLQDFSGTKKPILEKTDINAIVKETMSQFQIPKNVKLISELDRLPEIKADKNQMKRVFLNLTSNALQAMENGGTLTVSTKTANGFVEVSFKDTGAGIAKENKEKLFTPLFTTKAKGMGMGLPICKKFVESHGGSIEVETEEGKGSTFRVKLPLPQENGGENP
jgi:PAS domain S-box-containing protein